MQTPVSAGHGLDVLENETLQTIFRANGMTITRWRRKLLVRTFMRCTTAIKAKTMRWVEHVARIERLKRSLY